MNNVTVNSLQQNQSLNNISVSNVVQQVQSAQTQNSHTQSNTVLTSGNVYPTAMLTLAAVPNQNLNVIAAPIVVDFSNFTVNCVIDNRDS